MDGYIYNYSTPGNPVIDITGTTLTLLLNFQDKTSSAPSDHPASAVLAIGFLQAAVDKPLNQIFDEIWNLNLNTNGQTMMQAATAQVEQAITTQASGVSNVSGSFPATGSLRALIVADGPLFLSYWLPGASFTFNKGPLDAEWKLTFDTELLIGIDTSKWPAVTVTPSADLANANISAANKGADLDEAAQELINFVTGQPSNIFQAQEGTVDAYPAPPPDVSQLTTFFSDLAAAALPSGFLQCSPFIDTGTRTLNLRLIHPPDPTPTLVNGARVASLIGAVLGFSEPQVKAGSQVTAIGSNFPAIQATQAYLAWNDTTAGDITESDILVQGQLVTLPRSSYDNGNHYTVLNLNPGTSYQFRVRDCDALTCSDWSNLLTITTAESNEVDLVLSFDGQVIGSAILQDNGTFTTTVQIPLSVPPGTYMVQALLSGQLVMQSPITVVSANAIFTPVLLMINSATGIPYSGPALVIGNFPAPMRGLYFNPGNVDIFIDQIAGVPLTSANADSTGSFSVAPVWPASVTGDHNLIAQQGADHATAAVFTPPAVQ